MPWQWARPLNHGLGYTVSKALVQVSAVRSVSQAVVVLVVSVYHSWGSGGSPG